MPTNAAKKTFTMAVQHIVNSLERVVGDDLNLNLMQSSCSGAGHPIDTSALDEEYLFAHPKVQKAFKKFVVATIGSFQYMEEEFGVDD